MNQKSEEYLTPEEKRRRLEAKLKPCPFCSSDAYQTSQKQYTCVNGHTFSGFTRFAETKILLENITSTSTQLSEAF
jgi:hypothetical protein